jgi:Flavin containing amine oxidoreductase
LVARQCNRNTWSARGGVAAHFAMGSYAYIAVGTTPADLDVLAEPVDDRLFFAGEATVRAHWATVHRAYVSGLREAAPISGRREILPPRNFTENRRWRDMMLCANRFSNKGGAPGDAFGEYGLFGSGTRSARIRAEAPTVALVLDHQRFQLRLPRLPGQLSAARAPGLLSGLRLAFPESMAALLKLAVQRLLEREADSHSGTV